MASRKSTAMLEERVRALAARLTDELVRAVRESLASEVEALVRAATRGGARLRLGGPGDARIGKQPVPVRCPVPGCTSPGVRARRNFCPEHGAALTDAERRALRGEAAPRGASRGRKRAR